MLILRSRVSPTAQIDAACKPSCIAWPACYCWLLLLIVLWALGLMTSHTLGGLLHILLVVAIILFLVHVIQGRSIAD